ncbi:MAG: hypothetical protein AB7U83_06910 [Vicinamibacterales bacterium]
MHRGMLTGLLILAGAVQVACGDAAAPAVHAMAAGAQQRPILPPHPDGPIWGAVDPTILGDCPAEVHDAHVVAGGDGYRYRTWHPQVDPTGCVYAHEHGDDPAMMTDRDIAAAPVRFGYIGRRHPMEDEPAGHEEPHEGFKVFIALPGERNDEGRINRVFSRSVFHMGTGGPRRFTTRHHSAEIRLIHPEFGLKAFTQLMMDTGDVGAVCDPRTRAPIKDVMQIDSPCRVQSGYEIWTTQQSVHADGGKEVYRAFATPAVFDPITVLNRSNPSEVVYAWEPRMYASRAFPENDWSGNRGCDRESYAQPGYWYNAGGGEDYFTDAMGAPIDMHHPMALQQVISSSDSLRAPATRDGLAAFKIRRDYCQQADRLGLRN